MIDWLAAPLRPRRGARSVEGARLYGNLVEATPRQRRRVMKTLNQRDMAEVLKIARREGGTPFSLWADDPVGFMYDILGETAWSRPRQIMRSVHLHRRTAVPSCFASSKTHSAARIALWWAYTNPVGTALVVTMAPQWRQVIRLLWPELRAAHSRAGLPGDVGSAQLKLPDLRGREHVVAYGLAAPPWAEVAVQGIHAPRPLLLIDEAGGISPQIGNNIRGALIGDRARMLAIGNPPADSEDTWFEQLCTTTEEVHVIPISAYDTPQFTGEQAPRCRTCVYEVHAVDKHLVSPGWVAEAVTENGEESNYVQSKVFARFPRGGPTRVLPSVWVDNAADSDEPDDLDESGPTGAIRLCDLGLADERAEWKVFPGAWVRLGVDVAADGGDELVVARAVGDLVTIELISVGSENESFTVVADLILEQIRKADALRRRLGTRHPVRCKIDGLGLGYGAAGTLEAWGNERRHEAEIVTVLVSESTYRESESATLRPFNKRDEMWLAMRALLQPARGHESGRVRLRVDRRTLAQLRAPRRRPRTDGTTGVESKDSLRKRGITSPDRAEAVLLALYEPVLKPRGKVASVVR